MSNTVFMDGKSVSLNEAMSRLTDSWILEGKYCDQTVMDLRDEIAQLREEIKQLAIDNIMAQDQAARENKRLREQLYDATKAGTPYSKEQDSINGLVIDNFNKTAEIERLKDALRASQGGCRMLSQGNKCDCGLCKRDRTIRRLSAALTDIYMHGTDAPAAACYSEGEWWRKVAYSCMRIAGNALETQNKEKKAREL